MSYREPFAKFPSPPLVIEIIFFQSLPKMHDPRKGSEQRLIQKLRASDHLYVIISLNLSFPSFWRHATLRHFACHRCHLYLLRIFTFSVASTLPRETKASNEEVTVFKAVNVRRWTLPPLECSPRFSASWVFMSGVLLLSKCFSPLLVFLEFTFA